MSLRTYARRPLSPRNYREAAIELTHLCEAVPEPTQLPETLSSHHSARQPLHSRNTGVLPERTDCWEPKDKWRRSSASLLDHHPKIEHLNSTAKTSRREPKRINYTCVRSSQERNPRALALTLSSFQSSPSSPSLFHPSPSSLSLPSPSSHSLFLPVES